MAKHIINVPDIGGAKDVQIIEIYVAVGDSLEEEQPIVALESEKASMDIPASISGKVTALKINVGDTVSEGDALIELEVSDAESVVNAEETEQAQESEATQKTTSKSAMHMISVPDVGGAKDVQVIEIYVAVGDSLEEEQPIVALESDKASMDIPSTMAGTVTGLKVNVGDTVSEGDPLIELEVMDTKSVSTEKVAKVSGEKSAQQTEKSEVVKTSEQKASPVAVQTTPAVVSSSGDVYAGPAVRKFAREISVDLSQVTGTGQRSRITKSNVKDYVKQVMTGQSAVAGNMGVPTMPAVDFAAFGEVDIQAMSKIKKLTADNMSRNWLNVPHVTQFDDADITELEIFRKDLKAEAEKQGVKLTLMPFLLKACASALLAEPTFNASINTDGTQIVYKKYVHIGVAVDTPAGLMVPVLRDVDKKGLWQLAAEFTEITQKARDGKLMPADMQGGCFTISSLGAIGGNGFTPIVNVPEVAILGVSKASMKPVWNGNEFVPRQMLPLSLSYDHRAVNGADAGRFFTYLTAVVADIRRLLL